MSEESAPEPTVTPTASTGVLRLRGLPFAAAEDDIREFFKGFTLETIHICKRNGRTTGEAYVQVESPAVATEATTALHRQSMGHRYIEVFESSEADLTTAKAMSVDRVRGFVVRMRGLPYSATASDALKFFGDIGVVRGLEGVVFTYSPDGRPTGEAYVELQDEESQREAMKKHKELMGTRYIEIFVSTKADMIQAIQQNRLILGYANRKRWLQQNGVPTHGPVQMQGMGHHGHSNAMQYGQSMDDVTDMFSGFNIGGQGQVQLITPNGTVLPPGTYQIEVPADGAPRLASGGRGRGRQQQQNSYMKAAPRNNGAMWNNSRGSQQPRFAQQSMQQSQVIPMSNGGGQAVVLQQQPTQYTVIQQQPQMPQMQQLHQMQQMQQLQYEQQSWNPQVTTITMPQNSNNGNNTFHLQQGMGPTTTYTLATVQMPNNGSLNLDYQHLANGMQMDLPQVSNGLQTVELPAGMSGTLQIELPVSALGGGGELLMHGHRGARYEVYTF